jgi:hypothetical protein
VRFIIVGFLAAHYGPQIIQFFSKYYKPTLYTLIALAIAGVLAGLWAYLRFRRNQTASRHPTQPSSKTESRKAA